MSRTWHSKKKRQAIVEGEEHPFACVCPFCGKAQRGGQRKKERGAMQDALARASRPHHYVALMLDNDEV